jgi:hypothetical protein
MPHGSSAMPDQRELSQFQKQRLRWSARLLLMSLATLAVLTAPLLACAYIFNLLRPYNIGDPPLWAYLLLYGWLCGSLGPMSVAALLSLVRCPTCAHFMLHSRDPRIKTPVRIQFALLHAHRHGRIHCYRCGHEFTLA